MHFSAVQARVMGSLIEKQLTTPQQYPLTANALLLACNQTSNRHPVVAYEQATVIEALDELRDERLVRFVLPSHGRSVVRYRHVLDEVLALDGSDLAVLAVLLLRGPQTVGELRVRTERMAEFATLAEVERVLDGLAGREVPLVVRHGRRPGQKEERWADLLHDAAGDGPVPEARGTTSRPTGVGAASAPDAAGAGGGDGLAAVVARLEAEVAALRSEVAALRSELGG